MKTLLTLLFSGALLTGSAQTYMYISEAYITPESPVSTSDVVSIQLLGDFSDSGAGVDDYDISLDGTTVNLVINASSDGGLDVLTPFDISYELGTYEPGEYTVEISGTGIGVAIEGPLNFIVEDDGTGRLADPTNDLEIQIYPNPSSDIVFVAFETWENNSAIQLLSADGKIIQREPVLFETTELDVSGLENGVYLIRILKPNGTAIRIERLVIIH